MFYYVLYADKLPFLLNRCTFFYFWGTWWPPLMEDIFIYHLNTCSHLHSIQSHRANRTAQPTVAGRESGVQQDPLTCLQLHRKGSGDQFALFSQLTTMITMHVCGDVINWMKRTGRTPDNPVSKWAIILKTFKVPLEVKRGLAELWTSTEGARDKLLALLTDYSLWVHWAFQSSVPCGPGKVGQFRRVQANLEATRLKEPGVQAAANELQDVHWSAHVAGVDRTIYNIIFK